MSTPQHCTIMGSKTCLQGVTFLLLLKKTLHVLVPGLVTEHPPLLHPHSLHLPVLMAQDMLSLEATGKTCAFCSSGTGRVNTDVFSLHGDKSILLLPLAFSVKHKGMESWLEYSLCLNVSPFPSGTKSTPLSFRALGKFPRILSTGNPQGAEEATGIYCEAA